MSHTICFPKAVVYVNADGSPDAHVENGADIEVFLTQPDAPLQVVIVIPVDEARAWASELNAEVVNAHRHHINSVPHRGSEPGSTPPGRPAYHPAESRPGPCISAAGTDDTNPFKAEREQAP